MKRLVFALLLLFIFPAVVLGSTYEVRLDHGSNITNAVNRVREPNLEKKYFLYKLGDQRSQERADEKDATGTSEFEHDIERAKRVLEELDVCYNWVGEVIGFSNQLPHERTALGNAIVDRWQASPSHNAVITAPSGDWGGGGYVLSEAGTYFFAFYVVDVCGI